MEVVALPSVWFILRLALPRDPKTFERKLGAASDEAEVVFVMLFSDREGVDSSAEEEVLVFKSECVVPAEFASEEDDNISRAA